MKNGKSVYEMGCWFGTLPAYHKILGYDGIMRTLKFFYQNKEVGEYKYTETISLFLNLPQESVIYLYPRSVDIKNGKQIVSSFDVYNQKDFDNLYKFDVRRPYAYLPAYSLITAGVKYMGSNDRLAIIKDIGGYTHGFKKTVHEVYRDLNKIMSLN